MHQQTDLLLLNFIFYVDGGSKEEERAEKAELPQRALSRLNDKGLNYKKRHFSIFKRTYLFKVIMQLSSKAKLS